MASTTKTFTNNSPPSVEDDDLNGFKLENNNLILGSGQALNTGDNQQTNKAVVTYAGNGDFFNETGLANAYVLAALGAKAAPPVYTDGERVRFVVGNASTGPSTINGSGRGVKNFTLPGGVDFGVDTVIAGDRVVAEYDLGAGRFELRTILQATETRPGGAEIASAAEVLAATDLSRIVPPGGMSSHPGVGRGFVVFDGTQAVGPMVLLDSYNIASVEKTASGEFDYTFTNALPDGNYPILPSCLAFDIRPSGVPTTAGFSTKITAVGGGSAQNSSRVSVLIL